MPKTEVATTEPANVPAVAEQAALPELYGSAKASDVQFPEIRVMADLSDAVKARLAFPGDMLLMMGSTDEDPTHLIAPDKGLESFNAYLIARSQFAATTEDKKIIFQQQRDHDDPNSWEGYFFTLALPQIDPDIPARVMAWKTAWKPFIKKANFYIAKSLKEGGPPPHIKVTVQKKVSGGGFDYYAPQATLIPADEGLSAAIEMQKFAVSLSYENHAPEATAPSDLPPI